MSANPKAGSKRAGEKISKKEKRSRLREVALSVASTGLMAGETATVTAQPGWKGSQLTVVSGHVPPSKQEFDEVEDKTVFFEKLYTQIRHRPGISTEADARKWFLATAVETIDKMRYEFMSQTAVVVRMETIVGSIPESAENIVETGLDSVMGVDIAPLRVLEAFTCPDSFTVGHRRRLLFMLQYWVLDTVEAVDSQPPAALVWQIHNGVLRGTRVGVLDRPHRARLLRMTDENSVLYLSLPDIAGEPAKWSTTDDILGLVASAVGEGCSAVILEWLRPLDLHHLKSLVQKIIRCAANTVALCDPDNTIVSARFVLTVALVLMLGKSCFHPHAGGVEYGLQAMLKRLVIIAVEDSWPDIPDPEASVLRVMFYCLVSIRNPKWVPPRDLLVAWLKLAEKMRQSEHCCQFSVEEGLHCPKLDALPPDPSAAPMASISFVFDHFVGGMQGDSAMLRHVALRSAGRGIANVLSRNPARSYTACMPIYHFLDQHCATGIVYLAPPNGSMRDRIGSRDRASQTKPMAPLFHAIFSRLTGLNPRRMAPSLGRQTVITEMIASQPGDSAFLKEVQSAQRQFWAALHPVAPPVIDGVLQDWPIEYPRGWIACAVGVHRLGKWTWTLNPNDLGEIAVARLGSRQGLRVSSSSSSSVVVNQELADEAERESVVQSVKTLLTTGGGVRLSRFGNKCLTFHEEEGAFVPCIDGIPWESARQTSIPVRVGEWPEGAPPTDSLTAPRSHLDVRQCVSAVRRIIERTPRVGRALALVMLLSHRHELVFSLPDRLGGARRGGTIVTADRLDAWAMCKAIADLSTQLLAPKPRGDFHIFATRPELVMLRRQIVEQALRESERVVPIEEGSKQLEQLEAWFLNKTGLTLHTHQRLGLGRLLHRVVMERARAHFIWMEMGGGKTMLALLFVRLLALLQGTDPAQASCVFVTTDSAIETVKRDATKLGMPVYHVVSEETARAAGNGAVFVTHDVLKRDDVTTAMRDLITHSVVVLDEVHICTPSNTIRGSSTRTVAALAPHLLMMTATPLRSVRERTSLLELIQYVVPFSCDSEDALFVASSAMIRFPVYDSVPTVETLVQADCDDQTTLLKFVPQRMGGHFTERYLRPEQMKQAYDAAFAATNIHLVRLVRAELEAGTRPFVVAANYAHCAELKRLLLANGVPEAQIYADAAGQTRPRLDFEQCDPALRVAIVVITKCTGYSATYFNVRLRGVYPSNESDRSQIDARIARPGQVVRPVRLVTVHCGITTLFVNNHLNTSSIVRMMSEINSI